MAHQIILQPDGKFAIYSTVVDAFLHTDLTEAQVREITVEEAVNRVIVQATQLLDEKIALLKAGVPAYHQFSLTYEEALANHTERELENCDSQ